MEELTIRGHSGLRSPYKGTRNPGGAHHAHANSYRGQPHGTPRPDPLERQASSTSTPRGGPPSSSPRPRPLYAMLPLCVPLSQGRSSEDHRLCLSCASWLLPLGCEDTSAGCVAKAQLSAAHARVCRGFKLRLARSSFKHSVSSGHAPLELQRDF